MSKVLSDLRKRAITRVPISLDEEYLFNITPKIINISPALVN